MFKDSQYIQKTVRINKEKRKIANYMVVFMYIVEKQ